MHETKKDFFKDVKQWALNAPDGVKIIRLYNRGLITLSEAIRLISDAYIDNIKLINIRR